MRLPLRKLRILALISSVVSICGCAGTYRSPDVIEQEGFSVINVEPSLRQEPYIVRIDGKQRGVGSFNRYEVPPGVRAITASISTRWRANTITKCFLARAGESYVFVGEVKTNLFDTKGEWTFWIKDKEGNNVGDPC